MTIQSPESILQSAAVASGLVGPQQLDYCLRVARHRQSQQGLDVATPIPDSLLASILVEQNVLTSYQADQLLAGRTKLNLGPYIITEFIGQGGMGQVFKAEHRVMGRVCAVKVLPLARATQESRNSFAREIRMQAGLDCPYLVRAYDAGQDGSVHYLVTEFVPGMDLRRLVKSHGPLPVHQASKIIMQAAYGLDYAHGKDLVHRDVKPGNILVTPDGEAKVSDVGLAGFAKDLISDPRAGKIVGTTDYLSPEQIRTPLEIQPAADIYSLGCTLYYAVCGKVPFPGGNTASKIRRHLEETPWHPRKFAPDITEDFVDIIADMMEKDPTKRIASAAEVAARLEPWASDSLGVSAVPMSRSPWMAPPPPSDEPELDAANQTGNATNRKSDRGDLSFADNDRSGSGESLGSIAAVSSDGATSRPRATEDEGMFPMIGVDGPAPETPAQLATATPFNPAGNSGMSKGMVIALTAAIVIPPAVLVGAILGYIASR